MSKNIEVLIEIREKLTSIDNRLNSIKEDLSNDRKMMWRLLALTIIGAFALVGIKLALP